MKVLIYSDIHISQDSSIIKSLGTKYSTRLEHIIASKNWAEDLAVKLGCDRIFNLGDTFDKPIINAMEATAVQDIKWAEMPHSILVGNHDSNVASLEYSSVSILKKFGFDIISQPTSLYVGADIRFVFLPYITEDNRKPFTDYVTSKNDIVLSHNDVAGFNFGGFISKEGFDINDIKNNCRLFLNGHLHNSSFLAKNVLNVGNLCGQNFSEDAFKYNHGAWVLDTDNMHLDFYENPHALNFYKLEWSENIDKDLNNLKPNSCVVIKCESKYQSALKDKISKNPNIISSRVLLFEKELSSDKQDEIKLEKVDHLKLFCDTVHDYVGNTEIINSELVEVCK